MFKAVIYGLGSAGVLIASAVVSAKDPLLLQAGGAWNVRYDEDKCRLIRVFGTGDQKVELNLDQSGVEPFFTLVTLGKPFASKRRGRITVQFGPHENEADRSYLRGTIGDGDTPFVMMHGVQLGQAPEDAENGEFASAGIGTEREAMIEWLQIGDAMSTPVRLDLADFGAAMAALRACSEDLVKQLGLDEVGQARVATAAKLLNGKDLARAIDYPGMYQMQGSEGNVQIRLTVNKDGKPTNCQVARSSRPAVFDDVVCMGMMKTAEYEPAKDANGNPIMSRTTMEFTFQLD